MPAADAGRWAAWPSSAGAAGTAGPQVFKFTLCGDCGTANNPNLDFCSRCDHPIGDATGDGLKTFTAWDAGAFQAWQSEVAADSEEERTIQAYDVRPHPQRDISGCRFRVGPWALDLREQEDIWFINHGLKDIRRLEEEKGQSPGFLLCPVVASFSRGRNRRRLPNEARRRPSRTPRRLPPTPSDAPARPRLFAGTSAKRGHPKAPGAGHGFAAKRG